MRLLLDTHVVLWQLSVPDDLHTQIVGTGVRVLGLSVEDPLA